MKSFALGICVVVCAIVCFSFSNTSHTAYTNLYNNRIEDLRASLQLVLQHIEDSNKATLPADIAHARATMKAADIWLRYLDPLAYKKINSPLPVEWETEVFEKFEQPYRREGAGLTLAELYLDEKDWTRDSLRSLVAQALAAVDVYKADSTTKHLHTHHHFFLANRLMLLNLAAIYTTGFECPAPGRTIAELRSMLHAMKASYIAFNTSFPATPFTEEYLSAFDAMTRFADAQPADITDFDHFTFIKDHVNPLFQINQQLILKYHVVSSSLVDYTLNKQATSIFDKALYHGQNTKGVFIRVQDKEALALIDSVGKLLFNDPILSGNNQRSCASCHKPDQFFTDTATATSLHFNKADHLPRNTPTLINANYNHLVMLDGKHISLQNQTIDVITNPVEMGCRKEDVVKKVMSCKTYRSIFHKLLKYTPAEKEVTFQHIASTVTAYYSGFSNYYAPFDDAMNKKAVASASVQNGFNLFMGKAQCGTCHFVPQFNGVKPPYVGSEFEVIGVPEQADGRQLSDDDGRYTVNPAVETKNAFRTGTVRNAARTMPYMHNGVFRTLREVIDFYDAGGGAGRGLSVPNQTLSSDSLHLTQAEKNDLIAFIESLNENVPVEKTPTKLPVAHSKALKQRKPGGTY